MVRVPAQAASRLQNLSFLLVALVCLAGVAVMLGLSWFAHPSLADDYCYANKFIDLGLVGGLVDQYLGWSGGYTSTFLSGAIPYYFDYPSVYKFLPATLILLTCWAAAEWCVAVLRQSRRSPVPWLMGTGFTVLFFSQMPGIVSGFYWFNAAVTYQVANILVVFILTLLVRLIDPAHSGDNRNRQFFLLSAIVVLAMGCTETVMAAVFVLMNCACVWQLVARKDERWQWSLLLFVTYASLLVVVLAPGNSVRASVSDQTFLLIPAFRNTVSDGVVWLADYMSRPALWWASLVAVLVFCRYGWSRALEGRIGHAHVAAGVMITLSIPVALHFPAWLALGITPALRTQNAILFIFLLSWFCTLALISFRYLSLGRWGLAIQPLPARASLPAAAAGIALCVALVGNANIRLASGELFNEAAAYDAQMEHRYQLMHAANEAGQWTVELPLITNPPTTLNVIEIEGNSDDEGFLGCFGEFFGVPRVVVGGQE